MDLSSYVKHYLEETKKEKKETNKLYSRLNRKARKTAKMLGPKYCLKKIYLFGSLIDRDTFYIKSDIDLAVEGLNSEEYLDLWGDLERNLQHSFDLVNLDRAKQRLKSHILKDGAIIYDSQKKKG
jgi:predicted nucleotidyltransferase